MQRRRAERQHLSCGLAPGWLEAQVLAQAVAPGGFPFLLSHSPSECLSSPGSLIRKKAAGLESAATIRTKVFVWGLNDKDQLGGLKGSKVAGRSGLMGGVRTPQPPAGGVPGRSGLWSDPPPTA